MRHRTAPALAALFAALLAPRAPACAFTGVDTRTPLSAVPAPGGGVALRGRIGPDSPGIVRAALDRAGPGALVSVDSPGGAIAPALALGRLIRARGLPVSVARLADGRLTGAGAGCASACVLVLAAGVRREVPPGAGVGVHALVDWRTYSRTYDVYRVVTRRGAAVGRELVSSRLLSSREIYSPAPPRAYAEVAAYLAAMGVSPALVGMMRRTPAADLHWMTPAELGATRLTTGPG